MKAPIQSFRSKIRTASVCFEAHIHLYPNKAVISRFGKTGTLPEETVIDFRHISKILYGKSGGRSWITFRHEISSGYAADSIPYDDEHSVVFGLNKDIYSAEVYAAVKDSFEAFSKIQCT